MIKLLPLNVDKDHTAPTVLAGYFKFGSRTLLLGNYGTTGGGESVLNMIKINYHIPLVGGVLSQVTDAFNRGPLWHVSRCVRSNVHDAGVLICYE